MAGRARKERKYRAQWEQQQRDLAAAVNYQQNIINAYSTSPSITTRFNYQTNQEERGFIYSDPNILKGYRSGKRGRGRDTSSDVWIKESQIPAWREGLKAAAINAELFGLPAAKKAQQSAATWDQVMAAKAPYMSQRTLSRNAANKAGAATKAAQQELSNLTGITTFNIDGSVSTTPQKGSAGSKVSGGAIIDPKTGNIVFGQSTPVKDGFAVQSVLSKETKTKQQEYSDTYGIPTFDEFGNISTVPLSLSSINYDLLGISSKDALGNDIPDWEKKKQYKQGIVNTLLMSAAPEQLDSYNKQEKQIDTEIQDLQNQLSEWQRKNRNDISKLNEKESLEQQLREKLALKDEINAGQANVLSAYNMGDYNTLMIQLTKQYEDQNIGEKVASDFMLMSTPSDTLLKEYIDSKQTKIERKELDMSALQTSIQKIKNLQKNKDEKGLTAYISQVQSDWGIPVTSNTSDTIATLQKYRQVISEERAALKQQKNDLGAKLLSNLSNEEKLKYAEEQNRIATDQKLFEDITGVSTKGKTEKESLIEWLASVGAVKPREVFSSLKPGTAGVSKDWYNQWLSGSAMIYLQPDERKLSLYGESDSEKAASFSRAKSILSKYGEYKGLNSAFATDLIGGWKDELTRVYGEYSYVPSPSKSDISKEWFGTPYVEGESYIPNAEAEIGGIRGRDYFTQDLKKVIRITKGYEEQLKLDIAKRKEELKNFELERDSAIQQYQSNPSDIRTAVESSFSSGGTASLDTALISKLQDRSNILATANYNRNSAEVAIEYLEKSLEKTIEEREAIEKVAREQEFYDNQQISRPTITRVGQSPGRPSLKSYSQSTQNIVRQGNQNIRTSGGVTRVRNGRRSRDGLGGLVV